jgi:hypothetical protein
LLTKPDFAPALMITKACGSDPGFCEAGPM